MEAPEPSTHRLEAFSAGVFAVSATLLVLTLHVGTGGGLATELARQWPHYATYVVSFLTIGIIWLNHHAQFERIDHPALAPMPSFLPGSLGRLLGEHRHAGRQPRQPREQNALRLKVGERERRIVFLALHRKVVAIDAHDRHPRLGHDRQQGGGEGR